MNVVQIWMVAADHCAFTNMSQRCYRTALTCTIPGEIGNVLVESPSLRVESAWKRYNEALQLNETDETLSSEG